MAGILTTDSEPQPLKSVMAERGVTLQALAAAVGVNVSTLWRLTNGREQGSDPLRRRIADYLGEPEGRLFRARYCRLCGQVVGRPEADADPPDRGGTA